MHVNTFDGKDDWKESCLVSSGPVEGLHNMRKYFW